MKSLFDAVASIEFFNGEERRPLDNTVSGTVAACWYRDQPVVDDRDKATSGICVRFVSRRRMYSLGGYPGFTARRIAPLRLLVFRTAGVKRYNGRAGLSIGTHEFGMAYPDVQLYIQGEAPMWLDAPIITSIDVNRDDPRRTRIEWAST